MLNKRIACFGLLLCAQLTGEDVRFLRVSSTAYDLGIVVNREDFTDQNLLRRFRAFASSQTKRHRLSRLTVSPREIDLRFGLPGLSIIYENPRAFNEAWNQRHSIAQVVRLNGTASALIKRGGAVKYVQISGDRDPREFVLNGREVRLVSFDIHSDSISLEDVGPPSPDDWIGIDVEVNPLLTLAESEQLLAMLGSVLGTDALQLIVRSDSLFGLSGGVPFDVFRPPFPDVTTEAYMTTPYVSCTAWSKFAANSGQTCTIVRPDQEKRSLIGRDTP